MGGEGVESGPTVEELKKRNRALEFRLRTLLRGYRGIGALMALTVFGPRLAATVRAFFVATYSKRPPLEEAVDLFVAIIRRVVAVSFIGLGVATIPIVLLYEQNQLIEIQNAAILEQNAKIQSQLALQARATSRHEKATEIARRSNLLELIYAESDCSLVEERKRLDQLVLEAERRVRGLEMPSEIDEDLNFLAPSIVSVHRGGLWKARAELGRLKTQEMRCPPRAPRRLREEAVLELATIDRDRLCIEEAVVLGYDFSGAVLPGVDLSGSNVSGTSFRFAQLDGARILDASAVNTDFVGADLRGAALDGTDLSYSLFSSGTLNEARLEAADLTYAILTRADLTGADLSRANMMGANLTNAELAGARFFRANLANANLTDANLVEADLSYVDLSEVHNLTQAQLDTAVGDGLTRVPSHLVRPGSWPARLHSVSDP